MLLFLRWSSWELGIRKKNSAYVFSRKLLRFFLKKESTIFLYPNTSRDKIILSPLFPSFLSLSVFFSSYLIIHCLLQLLLLYRFLYALCEIRSCPTKRIYNGYQWINRVTYRQLRKSIRNSLNIKYYNKNIIILHDFLFRHVKTCIAKILLYFYLFVFAFITKKEIKRHETQCHNTYIDLTYLYEIIKIVGLLLH